MSKTECRRKMANKLLERVVNIKNELLAIKMQKREDELNRIWNVYPEELFLKMELYQIELQLETMTRWESE